MNDATSTTPRQIRPGADWERVDTGYGDVRYEIGDGIAKITICRPEVRNAFRPTTLFELQDAFERARNDPDVGVDRAHRRGPRRVLLRRRPAHPRRRRLRRRRRHRPPQRARPPGADPAAARSRWSRWSPGYAIGGGHVLHVVCDLTIAADNARFGQTGPRVGSFDGGYGSGLLARSVGQKKAREIWFLCRQYDAQAALDMGLVNTVVPLEELEEETVAWCRQMLEHSPLALRMIKASCNAADDGLAGIQQLAGDATLLYYMSEEAQEGKRAYLEKRKPDFDRFPKRP